MVVLSVPIGPFTVEAAVIVPCVGFLAFTAWVVAGKLARYVVVVTAAGQVL